MTLASAIYAAVKDLEVQVYPILAPQESKPPWLTYRVDQSSDEDELTYQTNGQLNPYWAVFYLTVWSESYAETDTKVEQYILSLFAYRSAQIQRIFFYGRQDLGDPDLGLFGCQLKFKCFTVEV